MWYKRTKTLQTAFDRMRNASKIPADCRYKHVDLRELVFQDDGETPTADGAEGHQKDGDGQHQRD